MFKKKGSLSLSINAIVILVLAIAMLGLGLAFTKTMFKKFQSKLSVPPPDIPATPEEPIVLPSEELNVKHGEDFVFQANFYNDHDDSRVIPQLVCYDILSNRVGTVIYDDVNEVFSPIDRAYKVIASPQRVKGGEYKAFKFIIPGRASRASGGQSLTGKLATCEISFCGDLGADHPTDEDADNPVKVCPPEYNSGDDAKPYWVESKQLVIRIT